MAAPRVITPSPQEVRFLLEGWGGLADLLESGVIHDVLQPVTTSADTQDNA